MSGEDYVTQINKITLLMLERSGLDEMLTTFAEVCLEYEDEMLEAMSAYTENEVWLLKNCEDLVKISKKLLCCFHDKIMLEPGVNFETVRKKMICVFTGKKYLFLREKYKLTDEDRKEIMYKNQSFCTT